MRDKRFKKEKSMRINITARHFKLSEKMKGYVEKEVYRLKKYYDGIIDVDVILKWEKKTRLAEINISVSGTVLTAHEHSENIAKSVDRAIDKLERQLKKYKDRLHRFEHETMGSEPFQREVEEFF